MRNKQLETPRPPAEPPASPRGSRKIKFPISRLIPESAMKSFTQPPKTPYTASANHEMDFVDSCKAGKPASADFSYSGPLTEVCQLGNVAKRVDARILWDAENMKVTNIPDANKYIRPEYRKGWSL